METYKIWSVNINILNPDIIMKQELIAEFYNLEQAKEFIEYKTTVCKEDFAIYDKKNNIIYSTEDTV